MWLRKKKAAQRDSDEERLMTSLWGEEDPLGIWSHFFQIAVGGESTSTHYQKFWRKPETDVKVTNFQRYFRNSWERILEMNAECQTRSPYFPVFILD